LYEINQRLDLSAVRAVKIVLPTNWNCQPTAALAKPAYRLLPVAVLAIEVQGYRRVQL
jgi:hypothetical protein